MITNSQKDEVGGANNQRSFNAIQEETTRKERPNLVQDLLLGLQQAV